MNERNEQTDETITELTMPPPTSGNNSTTLTTTTGATDWRDSYLESLHESERNDPVNRDLVAACSALADRVAALEAEKAVLQQQQQQQSDSQAQAQPTTPTPTTKPPTAGPPTTTTTATANDPATPPIDTAQARLDLAEALRSRGQLETRLRGAEEEVRRLRARAKTDERRVRDLVAERTALAARLKDRSEELVEKNRMVTSFQDEIVALTMELNVTEQKSARVAAENKELVDRWMKRMGEEADAMNLNLNLNGRENEPR